MRYAEIVKGLPSKEDRPDLYDSYDGAARPEGWVNPVKIPPRIEKLIAEHSLGKLYPYEDLEAVGYWYNPANGRHATIAWEAADGVNAHSDHADYPWENPEFFGITLAQVEEWEDTDVIRHGLTMMGWARIGYNNRWGMRVDAKNPKIAQRSIQWFAKHHGMPHAVSVDIVPAVLAYNGSFKTFNLQGDQVEEFVARGRLEPAWELKR